MATLYYVNNANNNWNGSAGPRWALYSGGTTGQPAPTAADDVVFDANSGSATVSMAAANFCKNLTITAGFTGKLSFTPGLALTISGNLADSTVGAMINSPLLVFNGSGACSIATTSNAASMVFSGDDTSIFTIEAGYSLSGAVTLNRGTMHGPQGSGITSFNTPNDTALRQIKNTPGYSTGTIYCTSGTNNLYYTWIENITAFGGAVFDGHNSCVDAGGNSGWTNLIQRAPGALFGDVA